MRDIDNKCEGRDLSQASRKRSILHKKKRTLWALDQNGTNGGARSVGGAQRAPRGGADRVCSAEPDYDAQEVAIVVGPTVLRVGEVEASQIWERLEGALLSASARRAPDAPVALVADLSGGGTWACQVSLSEATVLVEEIGRALTALEAGPPDLDDDDPLELGRGAGGFVIDEAAS